MKIRKNDTVEVISGNHRGQRGRVLAVIPGTSRAIVEGVNLIKRHTKPRQATQPGGIIEKEAPVHLSNLMLVCPKCDALTRARARILEDGVRTRACHKCGEMVGTA